MRNLIRGITAATLLALLPLAANAGVFVSINVAPPVLPVYAPPPLPGPGYLWTPGYWAWADGGYYWVPGTWVLAPAPGLLWTPGYWGFAGGAYLWHAGYWGPHVGFYGGVNYGFGYGGVGFHGGYWRGGTYVVDRVVINEPPPVNRVAFNGAGGIVARASPEELRFAHERHVEMSEIQRQHEVLAARDNTMRASFNHGRPPVAATAHPGVFYGHDVVASRSSPGHVPGAEHGMLGEHGAIGGGGAPHATNQTFSQTPHGAAAPEHGNYPGGTAHAGYPAAPHGGNPGAPHAGGMEAPHGEPPAHQAHPGHGGERDRGGAEHGRPG